MGSRSASHSAGGGGGGSERRLAPAVQHLFDMSQSPLSHTGSGGVGVPSRGRTEPGTQMKRLQPSTSSKKDGEVSFGPSSPSQSLLHLLRQGNSPGQQEAPLSSTPHPPAVGIHNLLVAATPAYQAPTRSTSQDYSAQGISNVTLVSQ